MVFLWELLGTVAFVVLFGALVLRWLSQGGARLPSPFSDPLPKREGSFPAAKTLGWVFVTALLFRIAVALGGLLLYNLVNGTVVGIAELPKLWERWDGTHYVHLAQLGYGGYIEEGKPLFLVFFPLYVWIVRVVGSVVPNIQLAGMLVSFLCFAWGSVYLYRLASEEYGDSMARRSLLLLWSYPFSFFFGGIMTESLFLLTTAAGLYHIRAHRWGRAAVWGILAAMTRMQGVLLIGAAFAELFCEVKPLEWHGEERRRALVKMAKQLPLIVMPVLGSLCYLALNSYIAGDPFAFTEMQQHWSQGFQWFPGVLAYLLKHALTWPRVIVRWEMWIPELVLFPVFVFLLLRSWKKHRSMFVLYGAVYFILNYCLSWLLSAGRYLACAVPFFLFGAEELEGRPKATALVVGAMVVLQGWFCCRYLCWGQVM